MTMRFSGKDRQGKRYYLAIQDDRVYLMDQAMVPHAMAHITSNPAELVFMLEDIRDAVMTPAQKVQGAIMAIRSSCPGITWDVLSGPTAEPPPVIAPAGVSAEEQRALLDLVTELADYAQSATLENDPLPACVDKARQVVAGTRPALVGDPATLLALMKQVLAVIDMTNPDHDSFVDSAADTIDELLKLEMPMREAVASSPPPFEWEFRFLRAVLDSYTQTKGKPHATRFSTDGLHELTDAKPYPYP